MELLAKPLVEKKHTGLLAMFSVLFFMWGLLTVLNFILIEHLKYIFELSYSLSLLINLTFFSTYLIASLPAGKLFNEISFKNGILIGWLAACLGCFVFYGAVYYKDFTLFLFALLLLAGGITVLQVGANLYVVIQGDRKFAASRLTLMQAFNSFGTFLAPFLAYQVLWWAVGLPAESKEHITKSDLFLMEAPYVHILYLLIGMLMLGFAVLINKSKIKDIDTSGIEPLNRITSLRRRHVMHFPQLRLGAFAIFAYVGAEVALANYLIDFADENVPYYWGLAMVGRFLGALILLKIKPRFAIGVCAIMANILIFVSFFTSGSVSVWAITAIGLFNSILFPSIFSLGINGLGRFAEEGAAVLVLFIVGGAIIPFMVRNFSYVDYKLAFLIPVVCYFYIALYGLKLSRFEKENKDN